MASFRVNKLAKTIVTAALPRKELRLPQSNLDLLFPRKLDMGVFFCYRKPARSDHSFGSIVSVLKNALSQTLVPYYAFSGEMVANAAGDQPELLCNNRGVDFEEACADVELRDLDFYRSDESVEGKLLPVLKHGVLAAQATQLRCGGVVVGCTFDHRVADGTSANLFWKSWSEMARSEPLSNLPSFRRSLLSPRFPGTFDSSVTDLYLPISKLPPYEEDSTQPPPAQPVSRIYSVSADQIRRLQLLASRGNPSLRTKLEAFSAFLWKLIASTGDQSCRLGLTVDGRKRIAANGEMSNYFGNVVSHSSGKKKCMELEEMPLSSIADEIHSFLDVAVKKEHFLGLVDFIEAHRPELVLYKMLAEKVSRENPVLIVSSGRDFPVAKMDFGWGKPVFGSYITPPVNIPCSSVLQMPSSSENGDWVISTRLPENQIEMIEKTADSVLKPFRLEMIENSRQCFKTFSSRNIIQ